MGRRKSEDELEQDNQVRFHDALERLFNRHGVSGVVTYSRVFALKSRDGEGGPVLTHCQGYANTWVFTPKRGHALARQADCADLVIIGQKLEDNEPEQAVKACFETIRQAAEKAQEGWEPEAYPDAEVESEPALIRRHPDFDN